MNQTYERAEKFQIENEIQKTIDQRCQIVDGKYCEEYKQLAHRLEIEKLVTQHWNSMIGNHGLIKSKVYYRYARPLDLEVEVKLKEMFYDKGYFFAYDREGKQFICHALDIE